MPSLVSVQNVSFTYGGSPLFENVSFSLDRGKKTALVGANGAGKSTLLALLSGQLTPDAGTISRSGEVVKVSQVPPMLSDEDKELSVEEWLDQAAMEGALDFEQTSKVIRALHLPPEVLMSDLSEGQRFKLHLAVSLFKPGVDLLLMDEPTSHLDLPSVLFLQEFVKAASCAVLIVSHDVRFLESVVDSVLELDVSTHTLRGTSATYEDYLKERGIRQRLAEASAAARERRVAALEADANRLKLAGSQGSQFAGTDKDKLQRDFKRDRAGRSSHAAGVKDRQRKRKMEEARDDDVPGDSVPFDILAALPGLGALGDVKHDAAHSLSMNEAIIGHASEGAPRFGPIDFSASFGEKLVLLGPNGCGKSTFLSSLQGSLPLIEGALEKGRDVQIGWLRQEAGCGLDPRISPLALIAPKMPGLPGEKHLRALTAIGLTLQAANKPIGNLSPGLTIRLALLDLMLDKTTFLLLDEVTNYVDRAAKEALMDFIPVFPGTVIAVTHDRELLDSISWSRFLEMQPDGSIMSLSQEDLEAQMIAATADAEDAVKLLL